MTFPIKGVRSGKGVPPSQVIQRARCPMCGCARLKINRSEKLNEQVTIRWYECTACFDLRKQPYRFKVQVI